MSMGQWLKAAYCREEDWAGTSFIIEEVKKALVPFRIGRVTIELEVGPYQTRSVIVRVWNYPGHAFRCAISEIEEQMLAYPEHLYEEVGRRAAAHFRNIPPLPRGDHIHLGEN